MCSISISSVNLCCHYLTIVVSGSRDATLRVWDIQTGECKKTLQGHFSAVRWYVCNLHNICNICNICQQQECFFLPKLLLW